jgi:hypothetical protein
MKRTLNRPDSRIVTGKDRLGIGHNLAAVMSVESAADCFKIDPSSIGCKSF